MSAKYKFYYPHVYPPARCAQTGAHTFQKRKAKENTRLELRKINGYFYIYKTHNTWNKQLKKTIKTTQILGSITPDGTYKPKRQKTNISTTQVYEYANAQLLLNLSQDIQNATANMPLKNELLALSIIRAIEPGPIRLAQTVWENIYLSRKINANLTPKNVSNTLCAIGNMVEETYELFAKLSPETGMLFYDLTSVLSYSKKLALAERGYNADWDSANQIKVALAFSTTTWLPVAIDVFYGSLKETKVLKYFIDRFPGVDLGFVMDRGFNSYKLLGDLKKENIHYIVPLKKDSKLLPGFAKMAGTFEYGKKRMIAFSKRRKRPYGFLYLFEDPSLREAMEGFLLGQVNKGELSMAEYQVERRMAGVFSILSDLDVEAQVVYEQYKEREEIEQAFDFMKNYLEADKTYLGRDDAVRGYFVVVFLAMRLYFKILKRLRERDLVGKVSVKEVLYTLSKMRMIVEVSGNEYLCALPKKTDQILEIFSDIVPVT
jgi:transposase